MIRLGNRCAALLLAALGSTATSASSLASTFNGDIGGAVYLFQSPVRGLQRSHQLLPYAYFDYGRLYARVDTVGVKLMPLGDGNLELAGRISMEGYRAQDAGLRGINDRATPVPIGIGSFQQTAYGGFFLYALHDFESSGTLLEATYAAEYDVGAWSLYPELGVERRSSAYVAHLYGVSAQEARDSGFPAYSPTAATSVMLGMAAEMTISGPWKLCLQWQHKRLGEGITASPLVSRKTEDSGYVALVFHIGQDL